MRRPALLAVALPATVAAVAAGCGSGVTTGCRQSPDRDLLLAIRAHAGSVVLPSETQEGNATRLTITACQTSDTEATATLTVFGRRDDSVRDTRSGLKLERRGGKWVVTADARTQRCQPGRGNQEFSSAKCT